MKLRDSIVFYRWWYGCIGLGFALLGARGLLLGQPMRLTLLRWLVAAGFLVLGALAFRPRSQ